MVISAAGTEDFSQIISGKICFETASITIS